MEQRRYQAAPAGRVCTAEVTSAINHVVLANKLCLCSLASLASVQGFITVIWWEGLWGFINRLLMRLLAKMVLNLRHKRGLLFWIVLVLTSDTPDLFQDPLSPTRGTSRRSGGSGRRWGWPVPCPATRPPWWSGARTERRWVNIFTLRSPVLRPFYP